jgi:hypothetical protein
MTTYTAQVGPDNAATLSETDTIEDIGGGSVQIDDLDALRALPEGADGSITDDEDDGLQIWIGGEGYPLFGAVDGAVADAFGAITKYDEAKHMFDYATQERDTAIKAVVDLAGSPAEAAKLLEMDEATVAAIVTPPAADETVAGADAEPPTASAPVEPATQTEHVGSLPDEEVQLADEDLAAGRS